MSPTQHSFASSVSGETTLTAHAAFETTRSYIHHDECTQQVDSTTRGLGCETIFTKLQKRGHGWVRAGKYGGTHVVRSSYQRNTDKNVRVGPRGQFFKLILLLISMSDVLPCIPRLNKKQVTCCLWRERKSWACKLPHLSITYLRAEHRSPRSTST